MGVILLLALLLISRMAGDPLEWVEERMGNTVAIVENPVLTPVRGESNVTAPTEGGQPPKAAEPTQPASANSDASTFPAPTDTPAVAPPTEVLPTEAPPTEIPPTAVPPTEAPATSTASPIPTETATATETPTAPATATPTHTASATTAAVPSARPAVSPTSTPAAITSTYSVQDGDTAFSIANRFQVTVAELLNVNKLSPMQALQLKPGTSLKIPGGGQPEDTQPGVTATAASIATSTPTPTATLQPTEIPPTATAAIRAALPGEQMYTVQSGDTLVGIALRFNTNTEALMAVNGLSVIEARLLNLGQQLIIPAPGRPLPPTATPGLFRYVVQDGDTIVEIAIRNGISTNLLLAVNGMSAAQAPSIRTGDELLIPAPGYVLSTGTPMPTVAPSATPTPALRPYVVQNGDTIVGIAIRNGISTNLLLTVNGMTAAQAPSLRTGDELLIPSPDYVLPTATPTPIAAATATSTPAPTPTNAIRLIAPSLIDPAQGINVPCSANQFVRWEPVPGLAPGDEYVLFLGYVNSEPNATGDVQVVPLLEQRDGQRTNWQMNPDYCGIAPQTFGRRWRWYVQVFNGDTPISSPSPVWEFTWR